jgi:acyl-CoA thioester hydrolase
LGVQSSSHRNKCLPDRSLLAYRDAVARVHEEFVSVRYAETDRMGVAHHSSYLLWFELARTGLLREAGHAYRDLEEGGARLPVLEYGCRFMKSADYDDSLRIETRVKDLRSRTVTFLYTVQREGETIAEGFTHHVCVDENFKPRRFPDEVLKAMHGYVVE